MGDVVQLDCMSRVGPWLVGLTQRTCRFERTPAVLCTVVPYNRVGYLLQVIPCLLLAVR
jgi:hypothetical protein